MTQQAEKSRSQQPPNRFSFAWLGFGTAAVFFTVFLSVLLQHQLSLHAELKELHSQFKDLQQEVASANQFAELSCTELKELREEVSTANLLAEFSIGKRETGQPGADQSVVHASSVTVENGPRTIPMDQMYRLLPGDSGYQDPLQQDFETHLTVAPTEPAPSIRF